LVFRIATQLESEDSLMNALRTLIVFSVEGQRFALRLTTVDRIERMVEITPLPKAPENVLGVVNRQGQIVPVFNLRHRLHLPERAIDPLDQLLFARTQHRSAALVVDAVEGVTEADERDLITSDAVLPGLEMLEGVAKLRDGLALIHDLERFLSLKEEAALADALRAHD